MGRKKRLDDFVRDRVRASELREFRRGLSKCEWSRDEVKAYNDALVDCSLEEE